MATIFTPTTPPNGNNDDANASNRSVITCNAASAGITQLRFQWRPNDVGGLASDQKHFSVGKLLAATNCSTTAIPIEIKFGGVSGINVAAGSGAVWSDWTDVSSLALVASDTIVLIGDNGPLGGYFSSVGSTNIVAWAWTSSGYESWNLADGSIHLSVGAWCFGINSIEGTQGVVIFSVGQSLDAPPKNTRMVGY